MMINVNVDDRKLRKLLKETPRALARGYTRGSGRALSRYRGFHRKHRMSRRSSSDRVGIWARAKGLKTNQHFPVKRGSSKVLDKSGATITVRNPILRQLEKGATITHPRILVPFSKRQTRGRPSTRTVSLLRAGKLVEIGRRGRRYLVERMKSGKLKFHYHIQRRIKIPRRLEFEKLFRKQYGKQARKIATREVDRELEKLNKKGSVA